MSVPRLALLASLALLAPGASPLFAQPSPAAADRFSERVEVNVVDVDVYVVDKHGNPVQGLKREDFEIFEDGKAMPVVNFYAVAGQASSSAAAPTPPTPPSPPATARPAPEPPPAPESQQLHLVVYIDNWDLLPFHRNRVLRQVRDFLRTRLSPADQVMLVTYDRALHVRHPFVPTAQAITADFAALEKMSANGIHRASERRQIFQLLQEESQVDCGEKQRQVDAYIASRYNDEVIRLSALQALIASLAGIEGRKAVLYVSDSVSLVPGAEAAALLKEVCGANSETRDIAARMRRLTNDANAHRVTLYTLEAAGVPPPPSASVESAGGALPSALEFFERGNRQDGLFNLASETGGRAILQTNDFTAPLARVAEELHSYYSLGYTPSHQGDNREHSIKVQVKRSGVTLRYRRTYRDQPAAERQEGRLVASLLHGIGENPLGAALEVGFPAVGEKQVYTVPVKLKLPMGNLVFLPQEGFAEARLHLWVVARDEAGRTTPIRRVTLPIRIPQDRLEGSKAQLYVYELKLQLEKGSHTLAVGIEDEAAASTSMVNGRVEVKG